MTLGCPPCGRANHRCADKGFDHIMWEMQGERMIGAAGCVAGAQLAFGQTPQYAKEREISMEYGIERVWRDMRVNRIGAGTDEVMLEVIGTSYGV